jgi:hypothetical protein
MQNDIKKYLAVSFLIATEALFASPSFTNSIALVGQSMDYREYNKAGVLVDSEESDFSEMTGAEINFALLLDQRTSSYSQIDVNFLGLGGNTKYTGSLLDSGEPYGSHVSSTANYIVDTEITYKKYYILSDVLEVNYGLGLGYYMWERSLSTSQVELYDWFYLKPTVGMRLEITKNLNIGLNLAYKYAINPAMSASSPNLDFTLGGVDVLEASVPLTYAFSNTFDMFIAFKVEEQKIKASGTEHSGGNDYYEPDSTAKNQYLKLGMTFKY